MDGVDRDVDDEPLLNLHLPQPRVSDAFSLSPAR